MQGDERWMSTNVLQPLTTGDEGYCCARAGEEPVCGMTVDPATTPDKHLGIAMGTGTDVAMERIRDAGQGDLQGDRAARRLSRATMGNIRQNLFFAFIFNALAVPIAAGLLYPAFGILLSPMIAGP